MAAPLAFGTYIPGDSPVHRLNAQVKILLTCVFSIAVFFVDGWVGMGLLVILTVLLYLLGGIKLSHALSGLKPILFILAFTVIVHFFTLDVNAVTAPGAASVGSLGLTQTYTFFGSFGVTLDGLARGLYFALRIGLLVAACSLLTFTTSMIELTDALLHLLKPLQRLHVPVEDFAMMVSIALRFIPTTAQEATRIVQAQKARGADFDNGRLVTRAKAWVPVFIPLFVRLFRRADELALAMDARCYRGEGRTHMRDAHMGSSDVVALLVLSAAMVVLCIYL